MCFLVPLLSRYWGALKGGWLAQPPLGVMAHMSRFCFSDPHEAAVIAYNNGCAMRWAAAPSSSVITWGVV